MVLADSPLSCIRIRTPDLLDANETNWAFVFVERVGFVNNSLVKRLTTLAT
jgi:hypothetical protein